MRILIAIRDPLLREKILSQNALELLERLGTCDVLHDEELKDVIGNYEAVITGWRSEKLTDEVLDRATDLEFIGHSAGTVVPYMDESVFSRGIRVVNANRVLARATAEGAFAMIQASSWKLAEYADTLRNGNWSDNEHDEVPGLAGKTLGLVGFGDITRQMIRLAGPYDMKILVASGHMTQQDAETLGVIHTDLETLLMQSDIISLHNTLTSATRGMIGDREFSMMKDGALFVNTARGPIVQSDALIRALETGRIRAVVDVYDSEPLPSDHPFRKLKNLSLYPHIAAFASTWKHELVHCVAEDLERFCKGEPLMGEITAEKFRRLTPR